MIKINRDLNTYTPQRNINQNTVNFGSLSRVPKADEFVSYTNSDYFNFLMKNKTIYGLYETYLINEGESSSTLQKAVQAAVPVLNKENFTYDDYNNLTKNEKNILRSLINKDKNVAPYLTLKSSSIKNDTDYVLKVAQNVKSNLDFKYPNGYKLVSIGNSAAPFTETMKLLGADTLTIPFSKSCLHQKQEFPYACFEPIEKNDWKKYIEFQGIDKNFEKRTGKKLIITDYVDSGQSMSIVKNIFKNLDFPADTEFTNFSNLTSYMPNSNKRNELNEHLLKTDFKHLSEKMSARLCNSYKINFVKYPEYIGNQSERFVSKLHKFALFEIFEEQKMPFFKRMLNKFIKHF